MRFKKPLTLLLLLGLISIAATFILTACDNGAGNSDDHIHSYVESVIPATCSERGQTTYTCSVCNHSYIIYPAALGHDIQTHAAKEATCTEIGWDTYETCSRCDYNTYNEITIDPQNHDIQTHNAKEPTCTEFGWTVYEDCSKCNYTTKQEIKALGHDKQQHEAKAATCAEIGWEAYEDCSRCDYTTYKEIEALDHDFVDNACTRCNHINASEGLLYVLSVDGTYYSLFGIGTCSDRNIVIASTYNGLPLKEIGERAFDENKFIRTVTVPNSVTFIGDLAFFGCTSLTSIIIPNSVTSIGSSAFSGCSSLASVTIGNGVISIGEYAFLDCSRITSISIPDSVSSIGRSAFHNCSGLKEVYYGGTAEDWDKISIGYDNSNLIRATHYYYSEEYPYNDEITYGNFWHYENGEIVVWKKN